MTHNVYTVFFVIPTQSAFLPFCVQVCANEVFNIVWPVDSLTAAQCLSLPIARRSLALPDRGYLIISNLDCRQPEQLAHLAWCFSSKCFLMGFLPTLKGLAVNWLGGTSVEWSGYWTLKMEVRAVGVTRDETVIAFDFSVICNCKKFHVIVDECDRVGKR
jgi:hypothetical protein